MNLSDLSYTIVQSNLINPLAYSLFPNNSSVDYSGNYYVGPSISFEIIHGNSSIQNYLKTLRSNTADLNININKYQPSDLSLPGTNYAGFTFNPPETSPNNFIEFSFNDLSLSYTSSILDNSFANSCTIKIRPWTVGNNLDSSFNLNGANTPSLVGSPFKDLCLNSITPETWSYIGIFNNLWMGGLFSGDQSFNNISCMANIIFDSILTPVQVLIPSGQNPSSSPAKYKLWLVNNKLTSSNTNFFYQFFLGKSALEYLNRWINYSFKQGVNDLSINIIDQSYGHEYNLFIKPTAGFRIDPSFIPCLSNNIGSNFFDYIFTNGPYYINNANIKISPYYRKFTTFVNSYNLLSYDDISNLHQHLQADICLNYGTLELTNIINSNLSLSLHSYLGEDSNFNSDITKIKFLLRDISDSNFNIKKFSNPEKLESDLSSIFPINLYEFSGTSLYIQSSLFYTPSGTISGDNLSFQLINNGYDIDTSYNENYLNKYYQELSFNLTDISLVYYPDNTYYSGELSFNNINNFIQNFINSHNLLGKDISYVLYNNNNSPIEKISNNFYFDISMDHQSSGSDPTAAWHVIFKQRLTKLSIDINSKKITIIFKSTYPVASATPIYYTSFSNINIRIFKYLENLENWELLGNPSNLMGDFSNSLFGTSIALNTTGDLLAVGAPGINDPSTAYCKVFQYNVSSNVWDLCGQEISYNTIEPPGSGHGPIKNFGQSVGIGRSWFSDLNTILLPYYRLPTADVSAQNLAALEYDFSNAHHINLDDSGNDHSFGKIVAFGSVNMIFVYKISVGGNTSIHFHQGVSGQNYGVIEPPPPLFGNCLAVNSTGPPYKLAIGDSDNSKCYIYDLSYDQNTNLINGATIYDCSFCDPSYNFPTSLSFNASGTILAVGATAKSGDICGCIQVFHFDSSNQPQRIGQIDNPSPQFGKSIAINNNATYDNNIVVVGAPGYISQSLYEHPVPLLNNLDYRDLSYLVKDYIDLSNGDCFVYKYDPSISDGSYSIYGSDITFETKKDVKTFGHSVAINDDGDCIAVGALWSSNFIKGLQSSGSVYTFKLK